MAVDAGIYALSGRGVKSVNDYDTEYEQLMGLRQQRQLGAMQIAEKQRAIKDAEAERSAYDRLIGASGGDQAKAAQLLMGSGNPNLYARGAAMAKAALDARDKESEIVSRGAKTKQSELESRIKAHEFYIQQLGPVADVQGARRWLSGAVTAGVMSMQEAQQGLQALQQMGPQGLNEWKSRALQGGMSAMEQMRAAREAAQAVETARANQAREAGIIRGQDLTDARTRSEGASNRAVTMRGQDLADARSRELATITKTDAQARREAEKTESGVQKYSATLQKEGIPEMEAAVSSVESIIGRYRTGTVPGVGRAAGAIPSALLSDDGNDVRQAVAAVRNIVLNARSGAAVTDQELRRLVEELGTGLGQSESALRRGLQKVRERLETVKANAAAGVSDDVKGLYEERGGVKIQRGGAKPVKSESADGAYSDQDKERRYQEWKKRQGG